MTDPAPFDRPRRPQPRAAPEVLKKLEEAVAAAEADAKPTRRAGRISRRNVLTAQCGRMVLFKERAEFMDKISDKLCSDDVHLLVFFLLRHKPETQIELNVRRLAKALGKSKDAVSRAAKSLNLRGLLLIKSGRKSRKSNVYMVTWPVGDPSIAPRDSAILAVVIS
jgi:hypothetical protein